MALLAFTVLATAVTDSAFAQIIVNPVSGTASTDYNATTTAANVTTIADLNGLNEHTGDATFRNWLNSAAGRAVTSAVGRTEARNG